MNTKDKTESESGLIRPSCPPDARNIMMTRTLRRTPMFRNLSESGLENLVSGCRIQILNKGDYLFHEAEVADGFYVVHSGAVNVHRVTEEGREQVIRVFYPGECFGEVILVGNQTYPASAKAIESTQVILIPTAFFKREIRRDPGLAISILASMSLHLRYLVETIESLKLRQAESRVAQWLIRQLQEQGLEWETRPALTLPLAKHLLASQLGITSETLSRVFARLRKLDLISIEGKSISFHSPERLRQFLIDAEGGAL